MKKNLFILALSLPCSAYAEKTIQYSLNADIYSEPVGVHAFLNGWETPNFKKGNNAFAHGKMKLETKQDNWTVGWIWTYDYQIHFSDDMAKLYYQIENDQLIDANKYNQLELEAQHVDTVGARFAYDWKVHPDWTIVTGATALIGRHYVDGKFQATGQTTNMTELMDRVAWLNGSLDYSYDRPALKEDELGWDGRTSQGYGYALDFGLHGQIKKDWKINLQVDDLFSYLYWDNAPFTRYNLHYDQNQRPRMDLSGQLSKSKQYRQKLPFKLSSEISYDAQTKPWSASISSFSNEYITLAQLNAFWKTEQLKYGLHIEPQTHALGLSVQHKNFGAKYMTDDLDSNQAHRFSASLYAQYHW